MKVPVDMGVAGSSDRLIGASQERQLNGAISLWGYQVVLGLYHGEMDKQGSGTMLPLWNRTGALS